MYSLLFHKDVFIPEGIQGIVHLFQEKMTGYFLSKHFEEHLNNQETEDRSHTYFRDCVMTSLNKMLSSERILRDAFEVELSKDYHYFGRSGWFVTKYCIRIPYDDDCDLVVVIRPQWNKEKAKFEMNNNMIVTAWLNNNKDNHYTLDASKYCDEITWKMKN